MPTLTRRDPSKPDTYIPNLYDAALEAVGRLRFTQHTMFPDLPEHEFHGYDQSILQEQSEYVAMLLEEAIERDERQRNPPDGGQ